MKALWICSSLIPGRILFEEHLLAHKQGCQKKISINTSIAGCLETCPTAERSTRYIRGRRTIYSYFTSNAN